MKRVLFLNIIASGFLLHAQTPYPTTVIDNSFPWTNGTINVNNVNKIIYYNSATNNVKAELKATEEILFSPNAIIANFNNGFFTAKIATSYLNPTSFHPNGWSNIGLFEKFEIGVQLPPTVQAQIDAFLNGGAGLNPYDFNQIQLKGTFSGYGARDGFYFRDINLTGNSGYTQSSSQFPFRIRFAPESIGQHELKLQLLVNGGVVDEFTVYFWVIDKGHKGFLHLNSVGKLQDSRGNNVFAIAQGMGYPNGNNTTSANNKSFNDQRGYISDLANNSGNFARIRLDPDGYDVEWEELGVYGSNRKPSENFLRQYNAYQLDKTLDLADSKQIYLFLTLMQDQVLTYTAPYGGNNIWPKSPYSSVVSQPQDILSNQQAKDYFKRKLRYVNARWGYSANIGILSLFNEADHIENYHDIYNGSTTRLNMGNWHCEMSAYLKTLAPYHLITTGYGDGTAFSGNIFKNREDLTSNCPGIDISSVNHYTTSKDVHKDRHDHIPYRVSTTVNTIYATGLKPFVFGEIGMTDCNPASDEYTDAEFHNSIWSTAMLDKAIGNGFYWYDWEERFPNFIHHRANYPALASFFNDNTILTNTFKSNWSSPVFNSIANRRTEWIENVNTLKTKGFGWIKNADYFWVNAPVNGLTWPIQGTEFNLACHTGQTGNKDDLHAYGYPNHNDYIQLHSLLPWMPYKINFYSCYNPNTIIGTEIKLTDILGVVRVKVDVKTDPTVWPGPDIAYKMQLLGIGFKLNQDSLSLNSTDTIYLPKSNPCINVNVTSDTSNASHRWDFGNGQTSNKPNPTICYYKDGLYTISHRYKDSLNNDVVQQQNKYIVLIDDTQQAEYKTYSKIYQATIYPNATSQSLFIKSNQNISDIYIYNQLGEELLKLTNINQTTLEIKDTQAFVAGSYLIKIGFAGSEYEIQKFIKL